VKNFGNTLRLGSTLLDRTVLIVSCDDSVYGVAAESSGVGASLGAGVEPDATLDLARIGAGGGGIRCWVASIDAVAAR
jgi:hypothetical protein